MIKRHSLSRRAKRVIESGDYTFHWEGKTMQKLLIWGSFMTLVAALIIFLWVFISNGINGASLLFQHHWAIKFYTTGHAFRALLSTFVVVSAMQWLMFRTLTVAPGPWKAREQKS